MRTPIIHAEIVAEDALQRAAGTAGAGSSGLLAFLNRLDVSVNKSNVDNAQSSSPILTTRTGLNLVGAYNGGGVGNKAILGIQGFNGMPVGELNTIEFIWREMEAAHTNPLALRVYVNLIIEPDPIGFPGVYKILTIQDTLGVVNVIPTPIGPGRWDYKWPTDANKLFLCVNPAGLPAPPNPVLSVWTNPPPGVPFFTAVDNTYFTQTFRLADIVAAYPNAILVDASSGDGGLPNSSVIPAFLVVVGDSSNALLSSRLIEQVKVNGVNV
jgi:hypothetical protein